jgi:uncharacterized protein
MIEGSVTIPGNPALEGVWVGTAGGVVVVAPPHPMMGGHLSNPVVEALAAGVVAAQHRALLFNFRGVGESFGDPSAAPADADEDFRAALAEAATASELVAAAGYSFGAAAALRAAARDERIRAVVAVAPPPALVGDISWQRLAGRLTLIAAERDHLAPPEALESFALAATRARFEVVAGADHFFGRGLDRVAELAEQALEKVR